MKTVLKLSPADQGRKVDFDDFCAADFEPGYKYELIRGRVDVSPLPNPPADAVEDWLYTKLKLFSLAHPEVTNHVTNKARVYVVDLDEVSYPEPDIRVYRNFPRDRRFEIRWREVSPILVIEILDPDKPDKDTVRNVDVYHSVPSIREYWIVDTREGEATRSLIVHKRHGQGWRTKTITFGETYTTRLLPGFELTVDPNT